jgi:hypothetical protein
MKMGSDDSALGVLRTKFDLGRETQDPECLFHLTIGTKFIEVMDCRRKGKSITLEIHAVSTRFRGLLADQYL